MQTKYLYESVSEPAFNNKEVAIITYDKNDEADRAEVQSIQDILWDIIYNAYNGKVAGMKNGKELIKRSEIVRVAFYNRQPVAAAFYTTRRGGNKMMYCGAVRGELHKIGKQAFEAIVQRDSENIPSELNWAEVSGPVESCFARCKQAFNLPNRYAKQALRKNEIELLEDGYHYNRVIGTDNEIFTKTIYGLPSEAILRELTQQVMGKTIKDARYCWQQIVTSKNLSESFNHVQVLDESGNPRIRTFGLTLIDHIDELYSYGEVREMPSELLEYLRLTAQLLAMMYKNDIAVSDAVEIANGILDTTGPLEFLPYTLSKKVEKIEVA